MPELPEVETVIRIISVVIGKKINEVKVIKEFLIKSSFSSKDFAKNVKNQTINNIERKGKYIFIILDDLVIISHLRMTGKYFLEKSNVFENNHLKNLGIVFNFEDKSQLFFCDERNFATFHLQSKDEYKNLYPYKNIGFDLINDKIDYKNLFLCFKKKRIPIKASLLEQNMISGIGNIYASEILFEIKVHPLSPTNSLNEDKVKELLEVAIKILKKSIEMKGTTVVDFVGPDGKSGSFQNELKVYNRNLDKCYVCSEKIKKIFINNRSTFFCLNCQPLLLNK